MKSLWSREGRSALNALKERESLYAFDYDGTLAPITLDPEAADTPRSVDALLASLARQYPTAVVSGRSVQDLKARLDTKNLILIGNHGLEGPAADRAVLDRARKITKDWIRALKELRDRPVIVEDKKFSISIHERGEDPQAVQKEILEFVEGLSPTPRVIGGKRIFNLMPTGRVDKGIALKKAIAKFKFKAALYVGDDVTDEDVFRKAMKSWVTVRVGRSRDSKAQFFIEEQGHIEQLLQFLLN